jgi:alpha-galactosidase
MSHAYHELYRTRLCRGRHRDRPRPVLVNNWEATYFDFNEEKLLAIAERARAVGAELFVLDDGWFAGATATPARSATGRSTSANCPAVYRALPRR